jgi:hypothetical protein
MKVRPWANSTTILIMTILIMTKLITVLLKMTFNIADFTCK